MLAVLNFVIAGLLLFYFVGIGGRDAARIWHHDRTNSTLGLMLALVGASSAFRRIVTGFVMLATPATNFFLLATAASVIPWMLGLIGFWYWGRNGDKQAVLTRPSYYIWFQAAITLIVGLGFVGFGYGLSLPFHTFLLMRWVLAALSFAMVGLFMRGQLDRLMQTGTLNLSGLLLAGFFASRASDNLVAGAVLAPIAYSPFVAVDVLSVLAMGGMLVMSYRVRKEKDVRDEKGTSIERRHATPDGHFGPEGY